jgi:deoxyadenosine/deoxycytidine kinase
MLYDDEKLQPHEFELYTRWLQHLQQTSTPLAGIIYVDTNPEVCLERIKLRSRDGEDCIPLDYLIQLDSYQSRWIQSETIPWIQTTALEEISAFVRKMLSDETN